VSANSGGAASPSPFRMVTGWKALVWRPRVVPNADLDVAAAPATTAAIADSDALPANGWTSRIRRPFSGRQARRAHALREQLPLSTPPPAASPEASRLAALRDNLRMRLMLSARTSAIREVSLDASPCLMSGTCLTSSNPASAVATTTQHDGVQQIFGL
jgi:hypothetical protein